jgi:type I restriction enzyme S subunit
MSTEWLKRYRILLPPMDVQNTFATFVEQSDKSKLKLQNSLAELSAIKYTH